MAMFAWVMMGIALWHFAIFIPDRFWGGIVGAFLGALFGAALFGLDQRLHDPRPERHTSCRRSRPYRARSSGWPRCTEGVRRGIPALDCEVRRLRERTAERCGMDPSWRPAALARC